MESTINRSDPPIEGSVIGERWILDWSKRLGAGGFATVFGAYDQQTEYCVAIKLLHEDGAYDDDVVKRFRRETQALLTLQHPHVVSVIGMGDYRERESKPERPFIVMPWMRGGSLADLLEEGRPDLESALRYLRQAAEAVDYLHSQGFIHRDIKPDNFLLNEDRQQLVISDLGLLRDLADRAAGSTRMAGTELYASPEQAARFLRAEKGWAKPDKPADIYSLAVVGYELLTGELPFDDDDPDIRRDRAVRGHLGEQPPAPSKIAPHLPHELDAVLVGQGLAKRAEDRPNTAGQLVNQLEDVLLVPRQTGLAGTAGPRRRRRLITFAAAAAVAIGASVFALDPLSQWGGSEDGQDTGRESDSADGTNESSGSGSEEDPEAPVERSGASEPEATEPESTPEGRAPRLSPPVRLRVHKWWVGATTADHQVKVNLGVANRSSRTQPIHAGPTSPIVLAIEKKGVPRSWSAPASQRPRYQIHGRYMLIRPNGNGEVVSFPPSFATYWSRKTLRPGEHWHRPGSPIRADRDGDLVFSVPVTDGPMKLGYKLPGRRVRFS